MTWTWVLEDCQRVESYMIRRTRKRSGALLVSNSAVKVGDGMGLVNVQIQMGYGLELDA